VFKTREFVAGALLKKQMPPKNADAKKSGGGVRGVSAEEKRARMLEIFKSAEVYSLKELEKIGSKKGIKRLSTAQQ
jgi:hypothetical protein